MSRSLSSWVKFISEQELPIFKYTVSAISDVVDNEESSTAELAQIILRDASLTARILRVANSTVYNPSSTSINTVSRAIVFIGFDLVRNLSLSLAVIEALLGDKATEDSHKLMAKSFHAAIQARAMAEQRGDHAPEEVFIAALLYHLGEIAFWCLGTKEAKQISKLRQQLSLSVEMAQKEVLGFTFNQLTVGLTQDWHLSDLLHSSINQSGLSNPRIQDIVLSHEVAERTVVSWDNKKTKQAIDKVASHLQQSSAITKTELKRIALEASKMAQLFGANTIIKYLPIPGSDNVLPNEEYLVEEFPVPDPVLQLKILRDLSGMLECKPNLNLILETVLEGIQRGVGMDRTLFAVFSADKKNQVSGKFALGTESEALVKAFQFNLAQQSVFRKVLEEQKPLWIKDTQRGEQAEWVGTKMRLTLACESFFIGPILIQQRLIGMLYCDRQPSERQLDSESFDSFRHFCQQANVSINLLMVR